MPQRIIIKNFGPISDAEIEIKKTVVLIGENAMGKSILLKLIATFLWIEKALFCGSEKKWFKRENRLRNSFLLYYKIEDLLTKNTVIEYYGEAYIIKYINNRISIENQLNNNYQLPKIMYVPTERNFIFYVRNAKKDLQLPDAVLDFISEYYRAAENLSEKFMLPIMNFEISYNKRHDMAYLRNKKQKIRITEVGNGLQSAFPLCLVSDYLFKSIQNNNQSEGTANNSMKQFQKEINTLRNDPSLTDKQKNIAIAALSGKFNRKAFFNIVEDPEQNLFPLSQMQLTKSLVSMCNQNKNSKLIIATNSPYILTSIHNLILAKKIGKKFPDKVNEKVNKQLWLSSNDVFAGIVRGGTVEQISNTQFDSIAKKQIDAVSHVINNDFDFLSQLETTCRAKNEPDLFD
jgi:predicted ATPase